MKKLVRVVLGIFCIGLAGCDLDEEYERLLELPLTIDAGQDLIVHNDVGSLDIFGNDAEISLKVKITGKGDTVEKAQKVAESIGITVENDGDTVCIKVDKPLEIKSDWFTVAYTIYAPQNINLEYNTDVGSASVSNIKGTISISCDVGSIKCKNAAGKLKLSTDVGDIHASFAEDTDGRVFADLSADVGSIHFNAPENLSATIDASTDVGSIRSDLPIAVQGNICSKTLHGTIGAGEGAVRLKTDVGSIEIE